MFLHSQTVILIPKASSVVGIVGAHATMLSWLRWDFANFLPGLALNLDPPYFCLSTS
jgi:hypothetical protein